MQGKVSYIQIPALEVSRSATFYQAVFGWTIRVRGDGEMAFDDKPGGVSGVWILGRPPSVEPGLLLYICVDDIESTIAAIVAAGGEITQPVGGDAGEITARFRDPGGNVLGIFEDR